jgi:tetratricopeptide (TPR) repeat protein
MNRQLPRIFFWLPVIVTPLLLTSCISSPKQKLPLLLQQAERRNVSGVNAESQGKLAAAESEFMEAHRLFSSIENFHGMVSTLINSSRVYRKRGDFAKAGGAIDHALNLGQHTPELAAEIYFERAKNSLAISALDDAGFWAGKAVKAAGEKELSRMLNLYSSICLRKGLLEKAKESAIAAEKSSRSSGEKSEEGNSLRTLAEVAFLEKRFNESLQLYQSALVVDKEVAVSSRISDDLRGAGKAFEMLGDFKAAALSFNRSAATNVAGREFSRAGDDLEKAASLYRKSGDELRASEALLSLEKLRAFRPGSDPN